MRIAAGTPSLLALLGAVALGCAGPAAPALQTSTAAHVSNAKERCSGVRLSRGLDLVVLGSGGPRSAGRAASSHLIGVGGTARVLIDAGPGAFARLGETGISDDHLDVVLLTHLHVDHAGDVPGIVKSRDLSSDGPVRYRVFGPGGRGPYPSTTDFVERLFGPRGAFAYLPSFRNELEIAPTDLSIDVGDEPRVVLDDHGLRVRSVAVDHRDVPAVAYRVEHAGRSVVVTGDLASRQTRIDELARGADVLVYDTAVLDPPGSPDELYELHTPPRRIGEVAAAAGVRTLLLAHVPPAVDERRSEVLRSIRATFDGDVRFAEDCLHVPLAAR